MAIGRRTVECTEQDAAQVVCVVLATTLFCLWFTAHLVQFDVLFGLVDPCECISLRRGVGRGALVVAESSHALDDPGALYFARKTSHETCYVFVSVTFYFNIYHSGNKLTTGHLSAQGCPMDVRCNPLKPSHCHHEARNGVVRPRSARTGRLLVIASRLSCGGESVAYLCTEEWERLVDCCRRGTFRLSCIRARPEIRVG